MSTATVSRVMSGNPAVSPELAARVHAAAEEMAYRPSGAARGLALGSLRNVGVIVPDLANAYFLEVVKQMHHGGRADGYRMLVADYSAAADDEYATAVDLLGQVDGLILLSSRIPVSGLKDLAAQSTPVVLVNRVELGVDLPMVAVDNFTAMMELCGHLAELGHRRVVYIAGSDLSWQNRERWRAVEMARVLGIEAFKVDSDGSIEGGFSVTESALGHEPTALICFNDLTAVGVISKLRELGVRVPEDISVTGFDDVELAGHIAPRLTTVLSPKIQLGDQAWRLLQEALRSEPGTLVPLLPAKVVIRDSTGTVRD